MKKIMKIMSALVLCASFVLTAVSCSNNVIEVDDYTGTVNAVSLESSGISYTWSYEDIELVITHDPHGDFADVFLTSVITEKDSSGTNIQRDNVCERFDLYKDGKETYIIAPIPVKNESGAIVASVERVPVKMEKNTIKVTVPTKCSFTVGVYTSVAEIKDLNFEFTKVK